MRTNGKTVFEFINMCAELRKQLCKTEFSFESNQIYLYFEQESLIFCLIRFSV